MAGLPVLSDNTGFWTSRMPAPGSRPGARNTTYERPHGRNRDVRLWSPPVSTAVTLARIIKTTLVSGSPDKPEDSN